jgi:hypothetical protein
MPIKVNVERIDQETLQKILDCYNSLKSEIEEPLELLDRFEGGFKIRIPEKNNVFDENDKIKQLRWYKQRLVPKYYIGFSEREEHLLFESLVQALKGNVEFEK